MFAVGDHVRVIRGCGKALPVGAILIVGACGSRYVNLVGVSGGWYHDRFEIAAASPTYRANDPATSKGKRKVNKYERAVLDMLRGGTNGYSVANKSWALTGKEIASQSGHPLNCITPRFAPLRRKGLIKDSGIKRDKQIVWVLA